MYKFKKIGNRYVVSLDNHAEVFHALTTFCTQEGIKSGCITGIGAINEMTLRFFDPNTKKYVDKEFKEQMEIANLTGNVSTLNSQVYLHLHITAGRADYSTIGGHLLRAQLNGAGEFIIEDFGVKIEREFNPEIGLNVYKL